MKALYQRSWGLKIFKVILFIILSLYAISLVLPLVWTFLTALKSQIEYSTYNVNGLPENWLFSNFALAFTELNVDGSNLFVMIFNSVWYTAGGVLIGMTVSAMVAYVTAKYEFPGRKILYGIALVIMMIPIVGSTPSQYRLYSQLGILDSPAFLVTFASGFGFNYLVLYAYFRSLPWSFAEAAFIDGAGHVKVFFQIMLPQAVSTMAALAIVAAITSWNDSGGPLLFLKSYPTLASGLYMFQVMTTRQLNMPVLYAGLLMSAVPMLLLFAFFSNKIMDMSLGGGLKG